MMRGWIKAIGTTVLAGVLFASGTVPAGAVGAGNELSAELDQPLPMTLYRYGRTVLDQQPIFRTNGQYEWKWVYKRNDFLNFISGGDGTFYYSDYDNVVHAVTSENEPVWTTEPMPNKIITMRRLHNGNIFMNLPDNTAVFHVFERKEQPRTYRAVLLDSGGKTVLDQIAIAPYEYFRGPITSLEQLVFLTEEGIVCFDSNGRKQWTYTDSVSVAKDEYHHILTNVQMLRFLKDGRIFLYTNDGFLRMIDSNGKLLSKEKATRTRVDVGDGTHLIVTVGEDGLYWWGEQRWTEEELREAWKNLLPKTYWPTLVTAWPEGTYSTSSEENSLIAMDRDGQVAWTYYTPEAQYGHPTDVIANSNGDVFFSDYGGNIYGLDSQGNELFRLIRNNRDMTSTELFLTPDGGLLGVTEDIGMFRIAKRSIGVSINGKSVPFELQPVLQDGTMLVPFRPVFEQLGLAVGWEGASQTVTGSKPGADIRLQIGATEAFVNGRAAALSAAPQIMEGAAYVPLRFVGEALGLQVEWDGVNREVRIGEPEQLARQAVVRLMEHLRQGDDYKATADLSDSNLSIMERAPTLASYFRNDQWNTEILSMTAEPDGPETFTVTTIQRYWSYRSGKLIENVRDQWYTVKRAADGQWKIEDSDLFRKKEG